MRAAFVIVIVVTGWSGLLTRLGRFCSLFLPDYITFFFFFIVASATGGTEAERPTVP